MHTHKEMELKYKPFSFPVCKISHTLVIYKTSLPYNKYSWWMCSHILTYQYWQTDVIVIWENWDVCFFMSNWNKWWHEVKATYLIFYQVFSPQKQGIFSICFIWSWQSSHHWIIRWLHVKIIRSFLAMKKHIWLLFLFQY